MLGAMKLPTSTERGKAVLGRVPRSPMRQGKTLNTIEQQE
jgi:hypothetical protein